MTENHIPPILGPSSVALTDNKLDPDSVEIVTHNFHQPASLNVANSSTTSHGEQSMTSSLHEDVASPQQHPTTTSSTHDLDEAASNYGAFDTPDIRRLSFVSFADVVHGEHAETTDHMSTRDSLHMGSTLSNQGQGVSSAFHNRSPSPVRSPASSHGFGTSPPTSISPSSIGLDMSPQRGIIGGSGGGGNQLAGSPLLSTCCPPPSNLGELNVETMSQALRRTGSGDLSGVRSQPMSAVGNDDGSYDRPFK